MSGHSKWSKVKHQKATTDVVKAKAFTRAARGIMIAVSEGGGVTDPDHNFRLRLAIEKAREVNVPKENIQRAIEKGRGAGGSGLQQVMYEAYGPHGVAILIEAATDNKQRTVSFVKNLFDQVGSSLASPGAVSYLFERRGILTVAKHHQDLDGILELALEAGADDVVETGDMFEIYTTVSSLQTVKQKLQEKGVELDNTEIIMKPKMPVSLDDEKMSHVDEFIEQIEALDDIQTVFTNIEN